MQGAEFTCDLKPNLEVSRYFMHWASLMQPFRAAELPLHTCRHVHDFQPEALSTSFKSVTSPG